MTAGSARALRVGQCGGAWGGDGRLTLTPLATKSSLPRLHNSVSTHGPQPKRSSCEKQVSGAFSVNRNNKKAP